MGISIGVSPPESSSLRGVYPEGTAGERKNRCLSVEGRVVQISQLLGTGAWRIAKARNTQAQPLKSRSMPTIKPITQAADSGKCRQMYRPKNKLMKPLTRTHGQP